MPLNRPFGNPFGRDTLACRHTAYIIARIDYMFCCIPSNEIHCCNGSSLISLTHTHQHVRDMRKGGYLGECARLQAIIPVVGGNARRHGPLKAVWCCVSKAKAHSDLACQTNADIFIAVNNKQALTGRYIILSLGAPIFSLISQGWRHCITSRPHCANEPSGQFLIFGHTYGFSAPLTLCARAIDRSQVAHGAAERRVQPQGHERVQGSHGGRAALGRRTRTLALLLPWGGPPGHRVGCRHCCCRCALLAPPLQLQSKTATLSAQCQPGIWALLLLYCVGPLLAILASMDTTVQLIEREGKAE